MGSGYGTVTTSCEKGIEISGPMKRGISLLDERLFASQNRCFWTHIDMELVPKIFPHLSVSTRRLCEDVDWINEVQNRFKWCALANTVMNIWVPSSYQNVLIS
jgi:hypothetical protein